MALSLITVGIQIKVDAYKRWRFAIEDWGLFITEILDI